jgi:Flp pilus assembly protein TadG
MRSLPATLRHGRQSAATTVTFVFIAPLFFLIVFATMEVGRVFNAWIVVTNEAREVARYGAVMYDPNNPMKVQTDVNFYINNRLSGVLDPNYVTYTVNVTGDTQQPQIQVTIYDNVPLITPIVSAVLPNPFPVAARSTMLAE